MVVEVSGPANMGDLYRAIYQTIWKLDQRHHLARHGAAANDA